MNKKGMMDDVFDFVFTVIAAFFCLGVLIFYLQAPLTATDEATHQLLVKNKAEQLFVQFIDTEVVVDGARMTILQLAESDVNDHFEEKLTVFQEAADNVFGPDFIYTPGHELYAEQLAKLRWQGAHPWTVGVYEKGELVENNAVLSKPLRGGSINCLIGRDFSTAIYLPESDREVVFCLLNVFVTR